MNVRAANPKLQFEIWEKFKIETWKSQIPIWASVSLEFQYARIDAEILKKSLMIVVLKFSTVQICTRIFDWREISRKFCHPNVDTDWTQKHENSVVWHRLSFLLSFFVHSSMYCIFSLHYVLSRAMLLLINLSEISSVLLMELIFRSCLQYCTFDTKYFEWTEPLGASRSL